MLISHIRTSEEVGMNLDHPVVRKLLSRGLCGRAEERRDEIEVGGFGDGQADLELHDVGGYGVLVFAEGGEEDLIQGQSAGADLAVDFYGQGFGGARR